MDKDTKRFALIVGGILLGIFVVIPGVLILGFSLYVNAKSVPSKIIDFHPAEFEAKATRPFFYSIGKELKYSDQIDSKAQTLMQGNISDFLVSPDNSKIAVAGDGGLRVVGLNGFGVRTVTAVDSIYHGFPDHRPIGKQFFRDDEFQWSRDSKTLYLIHDEFYNSQGSQLYSSKGELWEYDVATGSLQLVLKPFPAYSYFFGLKGIYFSVPTSKGDLRLRYFDGANVQDAGQINARSIPVSQLQAAFQESPFFSFDIFDYQRVVLASKGVNLSFDTKSNTEALEIKKRQYLKISEGNGFKGGYNCADTLRSVFLPGDRYFLFNTPYCGNYNGQLLIDTVTGHYKRLPPETRVYLTLNTETDPDYRVTSGGMMSW